MLLHVRKSEETLIVPPADIRDPNQFIYPAYKQGMDTLKAIVEKARGVLNQAQCDSPCGKQTYYEYSNNIIAFCGQRGQGKTSTLLSFTNALENIDIRTESDLSDCSFSVLPPIDPTILEEKQNILALFLSRVYQFAEYSWLNANRAAAFCPDNGPSESDKNDLLNKFQKCLSGINAIKFSKDSGIENLYDLHEISDSARLKSNIFSLVQSTLEFCEKRKKARYQFLVLQLDDTDVQIEKGYEILEDIRKYLSLPNIIVIMATDIDLLRRTVEQHFYKEFKATTDLNTEDTKEKIIKEMRIIACKYLDKLIPPTHEIHLPHLDDMIQTHYDDLEIIYTDAVKNGEKEDQKNLLQPRGYQGTCPEKDFSFQSLILRYIYRKTGIALVEPEQGAHFFIPTTLRGLCQLLRLLSSMPDIPTISQEEKDQQYKFAEKIEDQVNQAEENLLLFENYFMKSWIYVKLPVKQIEFITKELSVIPSDKRYKLVINYDQSHMPQDENEKSEIDRDYANMIKLVKEWKRKEQTQNTNLFITAVLMFFAIQFHKAVIRAKKRSILQWEYDVNRGNLVYDIAPDVYGLPCDYGFGISIQDLEEKGLVARISQANEKKLKSDSRLQPLCAYMITKYPEKGNYSTIFNIIKYYLAAGKKGEYVLFPTEGYQQHIISDLQEAAISVAANPEVQMLIEATLSNYKKENKNEKINTNAEFSIESEAPATQQSDVKASFFSYAAVNRMIEALGKINTKDFDPSARMLDYPFDQLFNGIFDEKEERGSILGAWYERMNQLINEAHAKKKNGHKQNQES